MSKSCEEISQDMGRPRCPATAADRHKGARDRKEGALVSSEA